MKLPKLNIKITLILLLIVGAISLYLIQNNNHKETLITTNLSTISKLPLGPMENESQNIDYSTNLSEQKATPPVFEYQATASPITDQNIALQFGFAPTDYNKSANMWFSPQIGRFGTNVIVGYYYFQPATATAATDTTALPYKKADQSFSSYLNRQLSPPPEKLTLTDIQYVKSNEYNVRLVSSYTLANQTRLYYGYLLDKLPLFMSTRPLASVTGVLDGEGKLINLTLYQFPTITQKKAISPITQAEAVELLKQNKGTLISATSSKQTENSPTLNFSKATISRSELVYIFIADQSRIVPVYRFFGTAPSLSASLVYNVCYLVPATK